MIESTIVPKPPPDPLLIPFDTLKPDAVGPYVNVLTQYAHEVGLGMRSGGQVIIHDDYMLVLLDIPVRGWCLSTGATVLFSAAILKTESNNQIEGWLVREREDAKRVYHEMITDTP